MSAILVIIVVSLILAALCSAQMDMVSDMSHYKYSIPAKLGWSIEWWCKELSYNNKYKGGKKENGAKFFGSTTFLVWVTDGWHLLKFLFNRFWQIPIALYLQSNLGLNFLISYVLIGGIFGVAFYVFYGK